MSVGPQVASAQGGNLLGRVIDSLGAPVIGANVLIQRAGVQATTTDSGLFRFALPAGRHVVEVRRVGFAPAFDSVVVPLGGLVDRRFTIGARVPTLDPIQVSRPLSAPMRGFENRRRTQQGSFITADEFKVFDGRPLRSVLARRLPGVRFVNYRGATYVSSTRGMATVDRRFQIRAVISDLRSPVGCWLQLYLDGARLYEPNGATDAVNINDFQTRDFEAIEFYSGAANTPPEFGTTYASCGTLAMWTRLP